MRLVHNIEAQTLDAVSDDGEVIVAISFSEISREGIPCYVQRDYQGDVVEKVLPNVADFTIEDSVVTKTIKAGYSPRYDSVGHLVGLERLTGDASLGITVKWPAWDLKYQGRTIAQVLRNVSTV